MDKELKSLVAEIIVLTLVLVIVVPICVNASEKYNRQKEVMLDRVGISVDISHNGDMKKVTIYSNYENPVNVCLIMKISRFSNDYEIYLDNQVYDIKNIEYSEDSEYRYYKLGIYEVDKKREFDFKLKAKGSLYYSETITYSFVTEGIL